MRSGRPSSLTACPRYSSRPAPPGPPASPVPTPSTPPWPPARSTSAGRAGTTRTSTGPRRTWSPSARRGTTPSGPRSSWPGPGAVDTATALLNGAEVFAWNHDKSYLAGLDGVPAVPTRTADTVAELAAAVAEFGTSVVKPRVGAGGGGVIVVEDPADPRLGTVVQSHPELPPSGGPWIVQPLVESVRTEGETSVFVLDGDAGLPGGQAARRRGDPRARALRRGVAPGAAAARGGRPRRGGAEGGRGRRAVPSTTAGSTCSGSRTARSRSASSS